MWGDAGTERGKRSVQQGRLSHGREMHAPAFAPGGVHAHDMTDHVHAAPSKILALVGHAGSCLESIGTGTRPITYTQALARLGGAFEETIEVARRFLLEHPTQPLQQTRSLCRGGLRAWQQYRDGVVRGMGALHNREAPSMHVEVVEGPSKLSCA